MQGEAIRTLGPKKKGPTRWCGKELSRLHAAYMREDASLEQLAKAFRTSIGGITRVVRMNNWPQRGRKRGDLPMPQPNKPRKPIKDRPSIHGLIALVAYNADVSPDSIRGGGRVTRLVNTRFAIAKLAEEFAPRLSAWQVDDAMLRAHPMTRWYRERHADRTRLYPDYKALYERCRAELLGAE